MRFIFYITIFFYLSFKAYADNAIEYLFIESKGNNIYEAQVKANHIGMQRALSIIANKLNIINFDSSSFRYIELKNIFTPYNLIPHNVQDNFYQGEVSYKYDKYKIANLFLENLKNTNQPYLYNTLLIPIFKSNKKLYFTDDTWYKKWESEISQKFNNYKIYYPFYNKKIEVELENNIDYKNLFLVNYNNFIDLFPDILFNKVVLAIGEYFYDGNRDLYFQVTERTLHSNLSNNTLTNNYPIQKNIDHAKLWHKIASDIIERQDISKHVAVEDSKDNNLLLSEHTKQLDNIDVDNSDEKSLKTRTITMHAEIYSMQEIDELKQKINKILGISNLDFQISLQLNTVNIIFDTELDNARLAENFYIHNLSYVLEGENDFTLLNYITKPTNESGI